MLHEYKLKRVPMKIKLITAILILSLSLSIGTAAEFRRHEVRIEINEENVAEVKETFSFRISGTEIVENREITEAELFEKLRTEGGDDFEKWDELSDDITIEPSVSGEIHDLKISTSDTYREDEVVLNYESRNLIKLEREEGRINHYTLDQSKLKFYDEDSEIVRIPDNTMLRISLPEDWEEDQINPPRDIWQKWEGNEYQWSTGTWNINMGYSIVEPITGWSPLGMWIAFRDTFIENPIYGLVLGILIVLSFIYRKEIKLLFSEGLAVEEEAEKPKEKL